MGVPRTPTYGKIWKTKRQTRIKPSGMTKVLEKYDTLWKNYDPDTFIKQVMGKGDNGLRDIQRNIDGFKTAQTEISSLAKTHAGDYDNDEKAVVKKVLADIDEELSFWSTKKKAFVLEEGGVKMAEGKLDKLSVAFAAAFDKAEARAKQLGAIHTKLSAADKYDDRRQPAVLEAFRKGVEDFETLLSDADARDNKLDLASTQVRKAYPTDADLGIAIDKLDKVRIAAHKKLKELWGDKAVWRLWVEKQLTHA